MVPGLGGGMRGCVLAAGGGRVGDTQVGGGLVEECQGRSARGQVPRLQPSGGVVAWLWEGITPGTPL